MINSMTIIPKSRSTDLIVCDTTGTGNLLTLDCNFIALKHNCKTFKSLLHMYKFARKIKKAIDNN